MRDRTRLTGVQADLLVSWLRAGVRTNAELLRLFKEGPYDWQIMFDLDFWCKRESGRDGQYKLKEGTVELAGKLAQLAATRPPYAPHIMDALLREQAIPGTRQQVQSGFVAFGSGSPNTGLAYANGVVMAYLDAALPPLFGKASPDLLRVMIPLLVREPFKYDSGSYILRLLDTSELYSLQALNVIMPPLVQHSLSAACVKAFTLSSDECEEYGLQQLVKCDGWQPAVTLPLLTRLSAKAQLVLVSSLVIRLGSLQQEVRAHIESALASGEY
jgi:hypothetical protein